ncbi:ComEA family DNA-binding protein [Paenibacillus albiflavus]|uniref:ComEA family DNA-binding protein n=1 Tax=Paenibacillus albiflavus TaxID=2545760 RepID=UPI0014043979|nr:helix-hairpin-helix domain-containing protein [Paenibacillus albiflavus]
MLRINNRLVLYLIMTGVILGLVVLLMVIFSRTTPIGGNITLLNESMEQLLSEQSNVKNGGGNSKQAASTSTSSATPDPAASASSNSSVNETAASEASPGETAGANSGGNSLPGAAPAPAENVGSKSSSTTNMDSDKVDLNTASAEQLVTLPGIGPSKAKEIIKYREKKSGFSSIEDLMNVKGIGPKIFEKLRSSVYVSSSSK